MNGKGIFVLLFVCASILFSSAIALAYDYDGYHWMDGGSYSDRYSRIDYPDYYGNSYFNRPVVPTRFVDYSYQVYYQPRVRYIYQVRDYYVNERPYVIHHQYSCNEYGPGYNCADSGGYGYYR